MSLNKKMNNLKKFEDEEFRWVVGCENIYIVSNYGRVFSLNYRRTGTIKELAYSFIKDKRSKSETHYVRAKMWFIRKDRGVSIHRVVAQAFCDNPLKKDQVNHINGNKSDNRACNLEWVSNQENQIHAWNGGFHQRPKGEDNKNAKIDEVTAIKIKKMLLSESPISISRKLNVSKFIVYDIKRNKTWRHLSL